MKVIIAGDRNFTDYNFVKEACGKILSFIDDVTVVSGHARGVDTLGEYFAKENGYKLRVFPADWEKFGRSAGPIRNTEMANYADALIAFLADGSKGTASMIKIAKNKGLKVVIINV